MQSFRQHLKEERGKDGANLTSTCLGRWSLVKLRRTDISRVGQSMDYIIGPSGKII